MADWPPACLQVTLGAVRACVTPMALVSGTTGELHYNVAMRDAFGLPVDLRVGCDDPGVPDALRSIVKDCLQASPDPGPSCRRDVLVDIARRDVHVPRWFDVEVSPVPMPAEQGPVLMLIAQDVTARRVALLGNEALEVRHRIAPENEGAAGMWDLELTGMRLSADPALARLFGIEARAARTGVSLDHFLWTIHADDRARLQHHLSETVQREIAFKSRYRLQLRDGSVLWMSLSGWPVHDYAGRLLRYTGLAMDVTEGAEVIEALRASEARFRTLAESLPQIVWTSGPDGIQNYVNQRWSEYTGQTFEAIGSARVPGPVHPEDVPASRQGWLRCVATGERYDTEYRIRHRSGHYRWFRVVAVPMRDDDGRIVQWFGTATDVHGERMLQRQRELIAGELDHRIRNLFSLIQAVVTRSMISRPECRPYAKEMANRIASLGRIYDVGHASGARNAKSFRKLILDMFEAYDDSRAPRLSFEGDDVELTESAAVAISLIVHELTTNAIKYGALSEADGTVKVSLARSADRCLFTWKEYGGRRMPPDEYQPGFGSRLIVAAVDEQLYGVKVRHWEPDGLRLTIDMPLQTLVPEAPHA